MHTNMIAPPRPVNTPHDLLPLHRQLTEEADRRAHDAAPLSSQAFRDAASTVHHLWLAWSHRRHATAALEAMHTAANKAIDAVTQGLAEATPRARDQWFSLAGEWIDDIRMQARPRA